MDLGLADVRKFYALNEKGNSLIQMAMGQLSARGYHRVLKLSWTIADLAGIECIGPPHWAEALQYRPRMGMMG